MDELIMENFKTGASLADMVAVGFRTEIVALPLALTAWQI